MKRMVFKRRWFRIAAPAGVMLAAAGVVCLAVSGCPRQEALEPERPKRLDGVPVVRVLVASGPTVPLATTGAYRIVVDGKTVARSMARLGRADVAWRAGAWGIHLAAYRGSTLTVEPLGPHARIRVGKTSYRGRVVLHAAADGQVLAVNHVDMESYLAGVLSKELYATWHDRAYEAQAIAARTYALYEKHAAGAGRMYDLRDDQSSQVYGGSSAETDKAWRAVRATHGVVLAAGASGAEKIFRAHYSACCGGTVNSVYVLWGPRVTDGPLGGGQSCDDCRKCSRYRWPPVTVPKDVIHRALAARYPAAAALQAVKTVTVAESLHGRPVWLDVAGPSGKSVRIRAADLRLCLLRLGHHSSRGLHSANCRIRDAGDAVLFDQGAGFGHGVGLCQWGAQFLATHGQTGEQILRYYYPGVELLRAY